MVFHWNLSDTKSTQVSRTLLSILAELFGWFPLILVSKSSCPFNNPLVTVTKSTNYYWYKHQFHVPQFFQFSSKAEVLILLFTFFQFYSVVSRDSEVHNFVSSLFFFLLLIIIRSGRLEIRWSVCMSKSHWSLCVSFSNTDVLLCIYHLFVWVFHTSVCWWFSTGVLGKASLFKSLRFFLVFWLISIML